MANSLFDKGRESFLSQNPALDFDTDTIKITLCDVADYVKNLATDQYYAIVTAAGRVATSAALASKTVAAGVADAADVTWPTVSGDPSEEIVGWKDTGVEATSPLIFDIDTATGLPVLPNSGDITVQWSAGASKIFKL